MDGDKVCIADTPDTLRTRKLFFYRLWVYTHNDYNIYLNI
jgi:hypothetical protein